MEEGETKTEEKPHHKLKRYRDGHKNHHKRRRHRYPRSEGGDTLDSRIMSGLEELEEESKAIREIATGINEEIEGHYDTNEVADIKSKFVTVLKSRRSHLKIGIPALS